MRKRKRKKKHVVTVMTPPLIVESTYNWVQQRLCIPPIARVNLLSLKGYSPNILRWQIMELNPHYSDNI